MELYVFDENLKHIGIIDDYTSLIWANRYNDIGDCEVYVGVTDKNMKLLKRGNFIQRTDDEMICRIKKVELETDIEQGDYLIVTGYDAKDILNQRIIWNILTFNGIVEKYIRKIVSDAFNMEETDTTQRQVEIFKLGQEKGFKDGISEQTAYDNVGEKVQALCKTYNYGYKVYRQGSHIFFEIYKGIDRSNRVVFSPEYDNLLSTKYTEDATAVKNVALVGGAGEGKDRITQTSSHIAGIDRYEMFVDASSVSNTMTYAKMKELYPGGTNVKESDNYIVYKNTLDIILIDNIQFNTLKDTYTDGQICYRSGSGYVIIPKDSRSLDKLKEDYPNQILLYRIPNVIIANLTTARISTTTGQIIPPADNDNVTIANLIYNDYLLNKGYEEISKHGIVTSFDGSIEPSTTFEYKKDYNLGDIVKAINEYGITANARITEIIETFDENGYSMIPKFEFMEVK